MNNYDNQRRDMFAAFAMQSLITGSASLTPKEIARQAYEVADKMLVECKKYDVTEEEKKEDENNG